MPRIKYTLTEATKRKLNNQINHIGEILFELRDTLKEVEGCNPKDIGFMKYLATIVDNEVAPQLVLPYDNTYQGFIEQCEVVQWQKGTFVSEWDTGEVISTPCKYDLKTGELDVEYSKGEVPSGAVEIEYVIPDGCEDEDEYLEVCPECHEHLLKVVIVNDSVGNGLHEEKLCPECN